jgi:MFS superfamily sulfate permease-like transporter
MSANTERATATTRIGWFPPARWLAEYKVAWLRGDVVAGVTLAAYAIPVSLAYAELAGLPPQVGVYGYLLGGLGYALFGSSRQLAIGPTSAISLMVAGTVGAMAEGDVQRYAQIASLAAFTVAMFCLIARQAHQRQHPCRLQGGCGADHRHDAASELSWRSRRGAQFL